MLNARYHEQEAEIVAQAGRPGAVTIATNMAGRGTDIQLGGNADMLVRQSEPEITAKFPDEAARKAEIERVAAEIRAEVLRNREIVLKAGGLYVVGTERHESRRIDNQLRGRSGRQGDPGALEVLPVAGRRPDAHLRQQQGARLGAEEGHGRRRGDRPIAGSTRRWRRRRARSRRATSRSARTCCASTT